MSLTIVEVGPRDGLQNEQTAISAQARFRLIKNLCEAGLNRIEIGAFVSPRWVPQMAGSDKLVKKVLRAQKAGQLPKRTKFSALTPNRKGMEDAIQTGIREVAVFGAASETFSKKNINCSISQSFERFDEVMELARFNKIKVRGYLSTAFGCPYEGKVPESRVQKLVERMLKLGVYEVSIGDTIGVATPKQVNSLLSKLCRNIPAQNLAMHFHDTRGTALANVLASLAHGIETFDSSLGGLGGCPYAKGASGNLATEDLVYMLSGMGLRSGVSLTKLIQAKKNIEKVLKRELPSRVGQADLPKPGTIPGIKN